MKLIVRLFVVLMFLMQMAIPAGAGLTTIYNDETLGVLHLNAVELYNIYASHAAELARPENRQKLGELEKKIWEATGKSAYLTDAVSWIDDFFARELLIPTGPLWFSIDAKFRPFLHLKADIRPLELAGFVESRIGGYLPTPVTREKDLVKYPVALADVKFDFAILPSCLTIHPLGRFSYTSGRERWDEFNRRAESTSALLLAEVDFKQIRRLLARQRYNSGHAFCFTNLRILTAALEMYAMDKELKMDRLDQEKLKAENYLKATLLCPEDGVYSSDSDGEVSCQIHGSIKKPAEPAELSEAGIPEQLRPFESIRLQMNRDSAELAVMLNDKNLLEQWLAIGRQQLLALKHMAQNQLGQLPEAEKQRGISMLDAIKINADGQWLKITVAGLDEKTFLLGLSGVVGAVSAAALPGIEKARDLSMNNACAANCKIMAAAVEMHEMDTGKVSESLNIEQLVNEKYLKNSPACPEGGAYDLKREGNGFRIECSIHNE